MTHAALWRRKWQPTPVFLWENPHGQKSLAGLWGRKELDMTEATAYMHVALNHRLCVCVCVCVTVAIEK